MVLEYLPTKCGHLGVNVSEDSSLDGDYIPNSIPKYIIPDRKAYPLIIQHSYGK